MNKKAIASELLRCAKMLVSIEFPSKEALEAYLKKHPGAKREDHSVAGKGKPTEKPTEKTEKPAKPSETGVVLPKKVNDKVNEITKHLETGNKDMANDRIQSLKNDLTSGDVKGNAAEHVKGLIDNFEKEVSKKAPAEKSTKTKVRSNTLKKVQNILNVHDLEPDSDELGELAGFKKTLGQRVPEKEKGKWFARNEAQLKAAFLKNMKQGNYDSPEEFKRAKKRIQEMPVSDFGKVLAAINDDEE
jgi:hypothetical protein